MSAMQADLFQPPSPGKTETSAAAAQKVERITDRIRRDIVELLRTGVCLTADELAAKLRRDPPNVRPRCTELIKAGTVTKTGATRKNAKGNHCSVLRYVGETS